MRREITTSFVCVCKKKLKLHFRSILHLESNDLFVWFVLFFEGILWIKSDKMPFENKHCLLCLINQQTRKGRLPFSLRIDQMETVLNDLYKNKNFKKQKKTTPNQTNKRTEMNSTSTARGSIEERRFLLGELEKKKENGLHGWVVLRLLVGHGCVTISTFQSANDKGIFVDAIKGPYLSVYLPSSEEKRLSSEEKRLRKEKKKEKLAVCATENLQRLQQGLLEPNCPFELEFPPEEPVTRTYSYHQQAETTKKRKRDGDGEEAEADADDSGDYPMIEYHDGEVEEEEAEKKKKEEEKKPKKKTTRIWTHLSS